MWLMIKKVMDFLVKVFVMFCIAFTLSHLFGLEGGRGPYISAVLSTVPFIILYFYIKYKRKKMS